MSCLRLLYPLLSSHYLSCLPALFCYTSFVRFTSLNFLNTHIPALLPWKYNHTFHCSSTELLPCLLTIPRACLMRCENAQLRMSKFRVYRCCHFGSHVNLSPLLRSAERPLQHDTSKVKLNFSLILRSVSDWRLCLPLIRLLSIHEHHVIKTHLHRRRTAETTASRIDTTQTVAYPKSTLFREHTKQDCWKEMSSFDWICCSLASLTYKNFGAVLILWFLSSVRSMMPIYTLGNSLQLHLMNDDLFSAHFLLRKMQEDEWGGYTSPLRMKSDPSRLTLIVDNGTLHLGKWLHACLHAAGEFT